MEFDVIEGLSQDEILELYDNVIYGDEKIAWADKGFYCKSSCQCADGSRRIAYSYNDGDITGRYWGRGRSWECSQSEVGQHGISGQCNDDNNYSYGISCSEYYKSRNFYCETKCECGDGSTTTAYSYNDGDATGRYYAGNWSFECKEGIGYDISGQCRYTYTRGYTNYCKRN